MRALIKPLPQIAWRAHFTHALHQPAAATCSPENIAQGPHLESAAAEYSLQFKQFLFGFTDLWMYESALPWTLLGFT